MNPDPLTNLGDEWELDAEPMLDIPDDAWKAPPSEPAEPPAAGDFPFFPATVAPPVAPPTIEQLLEAMVFVGGEPLTFKRAAGVIRGLTHQQFTGVLDDLAARYQRQRRPYALLLRQGSATLTLRPAFLGFRDRLLGGPRETRLTQPMIDVLSLVAYRQPVSGDEVNKIRGAESSGILRQLVRVGLIARSRDGENLYTTTKRFLEVFQLTGLDDLPRPVDPADPED